MKFKVSRTTREVQGVKFEYGGISFSGSKVSREFSYMNIDYQLRQNAFEDDSIIGRQLSGNRNRNGTDRIAEQFRR